MKTVHFGNLEIGKIPRLLCTVVEEDVEKSLVQVQKAIRNGADCIELRIDRLRSDEMVPELIKQGDILPALKGRGFSK